MRVVLVGPPGSGKGTQAVELAKRLQVPHISTGDIFRKNLREGTTLGKTARGYMDRGVLVPDSLTCEMVEDRLAQTDCSGGALLDGFPRSIPQAEWLLGWLNRSKQAAQVFSLEVPDSLLMERICGRRVCTKCGTPYHVSYNPPPPSCSVCGSLDIVHRADDKEEVVFARLETYQRETAPVLGVLGTLSVHSVDGVGTVDEIRGRILGFCPQEG